MDRNLGVAQRAVVGAGDNVVTLPNQVDRINRALAGIDPAPKATPRADEIIAALSSINTGLTSTDTSLKDTSGVLGTVVGTVNTVSAVLIDTNDPADRLGVRYDDVRRPDSEERVSEAPTVVLEGITAESRITCWCPNQGPTRSTPSTPSSGSPRNAHPTMTHRSTGVVERPRGEWQVLGDLTVRGVANAVPLTVRFDASITDSWGNARPRFTRARR